MSESMSSMACPRLCLPEVGLLRVEDVAAFYGVGTPAMRKRIRLRKDCPGWHVKGRRWVVRRDTFERWLDEQEGLDG